MTYSPRDISLQTFPSGVGGFQKGAVQSYLQELALHWESVLQEQQQTQLRLRQLEADLHEKRQAEDDIRRAIVAAEKIAFDLRENAKRESELLIQAAQARGQEIRQGHEQRLGDLERQHEQRLRELEIAFRARHSDLQREYHDFILQQERQHAERLELLEKQFSDRYVELSTRLNAARQEYAQFMGQFHALIRSCTDLGQRHPALEIEPLPPLASFPALIDTPEYTVEQGGLQGAQAEGAAVARLGV